MDTITHAVLGAAVSQTILKERLPRGAKLIGLIGAVGAALPDLDVFIYSFTDPTVSWLFHRHFTHSLLFVPLGGLIAALPFLFLQGYREYKRLVFLVAMLCYATHAPLDIFTSYGTQWFWPLSNARLALDWISIVDPVYSLPLLLGVVWTARTGRMWCGRIALLLTSLYLCFGGWQHHRGAVAQQQLAALRGHQIEQSRVLPAPGWLVMWRSIYTAKGQLYADGIRLNWFGTPRALEGGSAALTTFADLPASAQANAETHRRFEIFQWFAAGLISPIPHQETAFGDMRFTLEVESLVPLWGLKIDPATGEAQRWNPPVDQRRNLGKMLGNLILGDPRYRRLEELKPVR